MKNFDSLAPKPQKTALTHVSETVEGCCLIVTTGESVSRLHELRPQAKAGLRLAPSFSMAPGSAASAAVPAADGASAPAAETGPG